MGFRLMNIALLYNHLKVNIAITSYRGYGESSGSPSEEGLLIDSDTLFKWVREHPLVDSNKIVLFGRSLGGAVAIATAASNTDAIRATILEVGLLNHSCGVSCGEEYVRMGSVSFLSFFISFLLFFRILTLSITPPSTSLHRIPSHPSQTLWIPYSPFLPPSRATCFASAGRVKSVSLPSLIPFSSSQDKMMKSYPHLI